MLSFFPRGVLDEILNLIESVSEGIPEGIPSDSSLRIGDTVTKVSRQQTSRSPSVIADT